MAPPDPSVDKVMDVVPVRDMAAVLHVREGGGAWWRAAREGGRRRLLGGQAMGGGTAGHAMYIRFAMHQASQLAWSVVGRSNALPCAKTSRTNA